ncbi:MAG: serine/threonine protein kinase, partial [Caldilineaceae bacterium]|nr:serine/threonine protein kinase [Caldilineaceae bacterium]
IAVDRVIQWAEGLLNVLTYLHGQSPPVIHRDIKPSNLKLNEQGALILLDFGLAKGGAAPSFADRSLAGYTFHYAPPEQLRSEPTDARSDLYALAATLYHLLSTTKPTDALTRLSALATGSPSPLQPLHTLNPAVPPALADVIHQALALEPTARFAGAEAMRLALLAADGETTSFLTAPVGQPMPAPFNNLPTQLTSFVGR